ncbi:MAG: carbamoyltransferase [Phycisphaeraceae bacterium]|nr:carbamoyltransferase [Phycisphaeraceae bacterium]
MSAILGITFGHADSSACLVIDGRLVAAVAEERLGDRIKHCPLFPKQAVRSVLAEAGIGLDEVTHVAVPRNPNSNLASKVRYVLANPRRSAGAVIEHFARRRAPGESLDQLAEACDVDPATVRFETVPVEHHLAHIASAYYLSPFDGLTAGFSYDGSGDFVSAMAARCEGLEIEVLDRVALPHSLGFLYTAVCQHVGFDQFGEEYKVMGLNAYGDDACREALAGLVHYDDRTWFRLEPGYFRMHEGARSGAMDGDNRIVLDRMYTDRLVDLLGPARDRDAPIEQHHRDIARSLQVRFEEVAVHCFRRLHEMVPTERLAYAGGCALNGVANARILRDTPFTEPYLQCAASDDGAAVGAAYYCYHQHLGGTERFHMTHAYWGPAYGEDDLRRAADSCAMPARRYEDGPLLEAVAELLHRGLVVGWFQGRSEWGPRALGNRSILANPTLGHMQQLINEKIKRREQFRPFAPTVLREHVATYFEQEVSSPFMMHVVKIRPQWQQRLPAVTHVDGTGRLQTLERGQNPRYHDLIQAFARRSGVHSLLNTSFNENEPVVDTPDQAVQCFLRNDLDALCLGNHLVCKPAHAELLRSVSG